MAVLDGGVFLICMFAWIFLDSFIFNENKGVEIFQDRCYQFPEY